MRIERDKRDCNALDRKCRPAKRKVFAGPTAAELVVSSPILSSDVLYELLRRQSVHSINLDFAHSSWFPASTHLHGPRGADSAMLASTLGPITEGIKHVAEGGAEIRAPRINRGSPARPHRPID